MGTDTAVQHYLNETDKQIVSLSCIYLTESFSDVVKPFHSIVSILTKLRNPETAMEFIENNRDIIRKTAIGAMDAADDVIFGEHPEDKATTKKSKPKKTPSPTEKKTKTKKDAETFLKRLWDRLSVYFKDISYEQVKSIFYKVFVSVVRLLETAGIVSAIASLGYVAVSASTPIFIIISLLITISVLWNAFYHAQRTGDKVTIKDMIAAIMENLKKKISTFDLSDKEVAISALFVVMSTTVFFTLNSVWFFGFVSIVSTIIAFKKGGAEAGFAAAVLAGAKLAGTSITLFFAQWLCATAILFLCVDLIDEFLTAKYRKKKEDL